MIDRNSQLTLAFSCVGHTFAHLFMLIYPTVVLALQSEFDAPYHQLIGLMFIANVLFGAAALPAGYLGDKWSAARMMVLFFMGTGVGSVLTGFANGQLQITAGLAMIGLFGAIYHPVGIAWVVRRVVNRGKALGVNGVFGSLGVGLAPLLGAALTDTWSWRAAFILPGIFSLLIGLVLWFLIARGDVVDDKTVVSKTNPEASTWDMRRGAFMLLVTVSCTGLIYQATSFALPKIFEARLSGLLGDGLIGIGALVSGVYFVSGFAQLVGGWMADRFELKYVYLTCWLIQVPLLLITATLDTALLIPAAAAAVVANTIGSPSENSLFARFSPPRWRSTAFGLKFVLALGVASAAIPMIAWIYAATGDLYWLLVILAGVAVLAAIITGLLPRRTENASTLATEVSVKPAE
ncbi:MAG: MFS transporter [Rhodospirillaceae bacterium]|nr:MFS transporter [Rhodospirillaceae bacterium]